MILPVSDVTVNLILLCVVSAGSLSGTFSLAHFGNFDWAHNPWNLICEAFLKPSLKLLSSREDLYLFYHVPECCQPETTWNYPLRIFKPHSGNLGLKPRSGLWLFGRDYFSRWGWKRQVPFLSLLCRQVIAHSHLYWAQPAFEIQALRKGLLLDSPPWTGFIPCLLSRPTRHHGKGSGHQGSPSKKVLGSASWCPGPQLPLCLACADSLLSY